MIEQQSPSVSELARKQRGVRGGIALGIAGILTVVGGVYVFVPPLEMPTAGDRVAFALRCAVFPALTLLVGILAVAQSRYESDAIDPLARAERGALVVHGRYVANTLEQLVLHVIAMLGLAVDGTAVGLRLVPALTACFVAGRILFWMGYLRDPMKRAPGFAMTIHPTVLVLGYLALRAVWLLLTGR